MRYNKILHNKYFIEILAELNELEKERIFCKHGIEHLLDVARTAYIISLENNLSFEKDILYATALLHDIGRCEEYKNGTKHNIAGIKIAEEILLESDYSTEEINAILNAISKHRDMGDNNSLSGIIYLADKLTRRCFICKAEKECNWSKEKKNFDMRY